VAAVISVTLTDPAAPDAPLNFQVVPGQLPADYSMAERSWQPIAGGQVSVPKGPVVPKFTLIAWFPEANDVGQPFADALTWRPPIDIEFRLRTWMWGGTRLSLLVVGTSYASTVYIQSFKETWGELGRLGYELSLVEGGSMTVDVDVAAAPGSASFGQTRDDQPGQTRGGDDPPVPGTYTVKEGDTLSAIAALTYGDATKWTMLYDENKAPGGPIKDPNLLQTGWKLDVPGGEPAVRK
jgi:nucleoid-associated protein YgaU